MRRAVALTAQMKEPQLVRNFGDAIFDFRACLRLKAKTYHYQAQLIEECTVPIQFPALALS